jgi:SHS2 domain-containing protein
MQGVNVPFEILEHPADVGFLAYGKTLVELFENAALAMCSLACAQEKIEEREQREIVATGADMESLMYSWLTEILAVADAEQLVFRRVSVSELREPQGSTPGTAKGFAHGKKFDRSRHAAGTYIKAVTLHQFAVERTSEGFRARVYLDL